MRPLVFLAGFLASSVVTALPGTNPVVKRNSPCSPNSSSSLLSSATSAGSSSSTHSSSSSSTPIESSTSVSSESASSETPSSVSSGSSTPIESSTSVSTKSSSSETPSSVSSTPTSSTETPTSTPGSSTQTPSSASSTPGSSTTSSEASVCTGNTATTRDQWCDYSIDTDYTIEAPDTGVTREYWLVVTDVTVSPDGFSRPAMAVNGTIPGPTLYADWGDNVKIHVTNQLSNSGNGSTIHWHGIRQNYTNQHDGVPSITQCPLTVGETYTYEWKAVQYGTTWYHSHWALQAWEGVAGGIVINGPATANYEEDAGTIMLSDWDHETVDELEVTAKFTGPPQLQTGLINGTNVYGDDGNSSQTGERFKLNLKSGTSYRIRLINGAVDSHFKFSIDNHTMTVIAADLVPIKPYTATILNIGMGQRYDIIVTADQAAVASSFWMRAIPQSACSNNLNPTNIKGVVYYDDTDSSTLPATDGWAYVDGCDDETANLIPYISKTPGSADITELETAALDFTTYAPLVKWNLNSTTMIVDWGNPTLLQLQDNASFIQTDAVFEMPTADEWMYFIVQTDFGVPHPIHLHGHDFFILAQGSGDYSSNTTLNLSNPPRRDVAMLPANGHLVMAWQADNPGAWLMHCHIGWHTAEGFAVQFVERRSEILKMTDTTILDDVCTTWANENTIVQDDSGV